MSLIPHSFVPRSTFDCDQWFKPVNSWMQPFTGLNEQWKKQLNTLDMFDPFDALDSTIGHNMQWLNRPEFMLPMLPKVPQKYRITLDCTGFKPESIKFEWKGFVLTVWAKEEFKCEETKDFHLKEFKKTYTVPETAECDKMCSFMTGDGKLVIEVPLKETTQHLNTDLFPQIVDTIDGGKQMNMKFFVPKNILPEHIHVTIKDRCLIVKAEEKKIKSDGVSTFHYYKKTTLPENTDFEGLKCNYDNHQITVFAPINLNWTPTKKITFEGKGFPVTDKKCPITGTTAANKCVM